MQTVNFIRGFRRLYENLNSCCASPTVIANAAAPAYPYRLVSLALP